MIENRCSRRIPGTPTESKTGQARKCRAALPTHVTLAVVRRCAKATSACCSGSEPRRRSAGRGRCRAATSARTTLERSIRTHLTRKVDVAELSWLEQLDAQRPGRHPDEWQLATAYLGLVPLGLDPALPEDTAWHSIEQLPGLAFDHEAIVLAGRERLRAKLSYTNIGFALAPAEFSISELSAIYSAALGYPVDPTNLRRVLERRGRARGHRRAPRAGARGGRPAAVHRFASRDLEVTDPFAVPGRREAGRSAVGDAAARGASRPAHARPIFTGGLGA